MDVSVKCSCKCEILINENEFKNITKIKCPVCNAELPSEYIQKVKDCLALLKDISLVPRPANSSNGFADLRSLFRIQLIPPKNQSSN